MGLGFNSSKSKQQSQSSSSTANQAYGTLNNAFSPVLDQTANSGNFIQQLLGMQGGDQANDAFQKYLGSTGYQFQQQQGANAITNNAATHGLLHSGSTLKALSDYGQNTGAGYFNNFLQQLLGLGTQGIQAGQVLGGAGNTSQSQSTGSGSGSSFGAQASFK
jgi:hypothetical protein